MAATTYLIACRSTAVNGGGSIIKRDPLADTWTVVYTHSDFGWSASGCWGAVSDDGSYIAVLYHSNARLGMIESLDGGETWSSPVFSSASYKNCRGIYVKAQNDVIILCENGSSRRVLVHWNGTSLLQVVDMTSVSTASEARQIHGIGGYVLAVSEKYNEAGRTRLNSNGNMRSSGDWASIASPDFTRSAGAVQAYSDTEVYCGSTANLWWNSFAVWNGSSWQILARPEPPGQYINLGGFARRSVDADPDQFIYAPQWNSGGRIFKYTPGGGWAQDQYIGLYVRMGTGSYVPGVDTLVFGAKYWTTGAPYIVEKRFGVDANWTQINLQSIKLGLLDYSSPIVVPSAGGVKRTQPDGGSLMVGDTHRNIEERWRRNLRHGD